MTEDSLNISLGIIDDHQIVRQGLMELLSSMSIPVNDQYKDGQSFLTFLDSDIAKPSSIYLIDYSMPRMNGIEVVKQVVEKYSDIKFIMLTQHINDKLKIEAYEAGMRAFLNKTCTAQELKTTIQNVATYGFNNFEEILRLLRNKNTVDELSNHSEIRLTDRELQFLELVCDDKEFTYQQIADQMNLSVKSIDACRSGLFDKLSVRSKVGLVLYSFHHKVTKPFKSKERGN